MELLRNLRLLIFTFILFLAFNNGTAADIKGLGVPYVQNYTKHVYQSGNQNWAVTKDENGIMYFGNSEGLLSFDGRYWQLNRMPNHLIVRSVAADGKGRVYAGGFGEFGYWAYNHKGRLVYHSLTRLLPAGFTLKDEIWKIYVDGERVLFQSFASVFIYHKGKIRVLEKGGPFFFLLKAGSRFFIKSMGKGFYEIKGDKLAGIPNSELLDNTEVLCILPFQKGKYLIGTAKKGLFIYDGISIKPWDNHANGFLKTYHLNNGCVVMNRYFAFGTILNGIVILDEAGRIVQQINKSSGLQNNTVLSIYSDNEQNLWAGLDNGIDRIELNSPLYFYFDKKGDLGTVYSSIIHQSKIYLGTNQGLFYSDLQNHGSDSFQSFDFKLIPGSQGQVWDLSLIDGQLFCGHNDGTSLVIGNTLKKISSVSGGWIIRRLNSNPNLLIQGTYNGLAVYKKGPDGKWEFSHKVSGFSEPSNYVEQDAKGQIWVGHAYKGLYKLQLNSDYRKVVSFRYYGSNNGLPGSYHLNVFNLENRVVFSSDSGFYIYDDISNRFSKYNHLNRGLGSFAFSNKIIPAAARKYWFINHGKVALVSLTEPGQIKVDSSSFTILDGRMVQYYENISRINSSLYLISIDDGFSIYDGNSINVNAYNAKSLPRVLIRKFENITYGNMLISEAAGLDITEIPYNRNNVRISFALPYYRQAKIRYQYYLEGYSSQWSEWSSQAAKEFTNLGNGSYTFKVRAIINDRKISESASFQFIILPPWYLSKWAYFSYLLLHIALFLILRRMYFYNIKKHQERLRKKLQKEKEEQLRQEAIINEQKIVKLKNEQLQADLESKSRELTSSAMNIVYKNELLQKIRDEIYGLKDSSGKKLGSDQLKRLDKVINEGLNDERDWNVFESSFNETHENFFRKLKSKYPELVPNDLKLCAYLRMNMSSKEIASLLNITLRGVEIRRYRLRKKLNLEHDKNLAEFFMQL
ncbi:YXYXY domain-containing protein [Arcticibacter tournemirensis]|uniref:Transcriptional regulator n=1 Tax=Arcticibacter tournemirensis TaxID=699437 RepID=A0A5M9GZX4_9SPHI|nr:triple tyrosine motif-containing protein [Arcticibacter tournemirensis]KAA8480216.1 transcriptional regulator [Arcticibacter tournemirensis]TQM46776.1 YXYXY domain-containing protein [Arcticibacter tournemirensis]